MNEITSKSSLKNVLAVKGVEEVLDKYQVPCLTCPMAAMEMDQLTIGQICEKYHIEEKALISDINSIK